MERLFKQWLHQTKVNPAHVAKTAIVIVAKASKTNKKDLRDWTGMGLRLDSAPAQDPTSDRPTAGLGVVRQVKPLIGPLSTVLKLLMLLNFSTPGESSQNVIVHVFVSEFWF
ncbi:hypothetical protein WMY93_022975 [Mugilogobius chulae]|uniref:Uncharacterized protein n=1 Tax=Mugilogobius chulae TaxID=88201 RepID=A0AAW0N7G4_9GOBI